MTLRVAEARVFNLSFGRVRPDPIRFSWRSAKLTALLGHDVDFAAQLFNHTELFEGENKFLAFHSVENKQNLGHNYRAAAHTGYLRVEYPDFPADYTDVVMEDGNLFVREVVAPILSFLQRRRVLIGILHFTSSERLVISMPAFLAGEWIDSVAFGPEAISSEDIEAALVASLIRYEALNEDAKGRIRMLLLRYNELLNLPYVHERVEGLWRIVETLGGTVQHTPQMDAEHNRLLTICGAQRSENLRLLVNSLIHYNMPYTDDNVRESREFRNHSTHEYLDPALTSWQSLSAIFHFLQKCVDKAVITELGISHLPFKNAGFTIIQNRVL